MANILISVGIAIVSFFNIMVALFIAENIKTHDPILWTCLALIVNSLLIYLIIR